MGFWHTWMGIEGGGGPTVLGSGLAVVTFASEQVGLAFSSQQITVSFPGGVIVGVVNRLPDLACEESTYAVVLTVTDEDDVALEPDSLAWSLSRTDGTIINSREDVAVSPLGSTMTVVLSGDDLELFTDDNRLRRVTFEGTFTSDLGSGLPMTAEVEFQIADLVGVT